MAQFTDLPNELVDDILERVRDAKKLRPFLLCRRTHDSALSAIYKHITVHYDKIEALLQATNRPSLLKAYAHAKTLKVTVPNHYWLCFTCRATCALRFIFPRPRCDTCDQKPPFGLEYDASAAQVLNTRIDSLLALANSKISVLNLVCRPNPCELSISSTHLKHVSISATTELIDLGANDRSVVSLKWLAPSNLRSLSINADSVLLSGDLNLQLITRLEVMHGAVLRIQDVDHKFDMMLRDDPPLPFSKLRDFSLTLAGTQYLKLPRWLQNLAHVLVTFKSSLIRLSLTSEHHHLCTAASVNVVDFTPYILLRELKLGWKLEVECHNLCGTKDANRLFLLAPSLEVVEFTLQAPVTSLQALLSGLKEFLVGNSVLVQGSSLNKIRCSVEPDFLGRTRTAYHTKYLETMASDWGLSDYVAVVYKDGRVALKKQQAVNDYTKTIAALGELVFDQAAELKDLEAFYGVKIDVSEVRKVVDHEFGMLADEEWMLE